MRSRVTEAREAVIAAARKVTTGIHSSASEFDIAMEQLFASVSALNALEPNAIVNTEGASVVGAPDTSSQAAKLLYPTSGTVRRRVVDFIAASHDGLATCEMVERRLNMRHATASSAINWLVGNGWLEDSRQRALTTSKRKAVLWRLTPAASAKLKGRST